MIIILITVKQQVFITKINRENTALKYILRQNNIRCLSRVKSAKTIHIKLSVKKQGNKKLYNNALITVIIDLF